MGVKDLAALIRRSAPSAVTPINDLRTFRNKTFAIDGNLLTTKFHHVPPPTWLPFLRNSPPELAERHKHVYWWFAFVLALQREDIKAIVVFDGEGRMEEKSDENRRRNAARDLQRRRAEAERMRGDRIQQLQATWAQVELLSKDKLLKSFRKVIESLPVGSTSADADGIEGDASQGVFIGDQELEDGLRLEAMRLTEDAIQEERSLQNEVTILKSLVDVTPITPYLATPPSAMGDTSQNVSAEEQLGATFADDWTVSPDIISPEEEIAFEQEPDSQGLTEEEIATLQTLINLQQLSSADVNNPLYTELQRGVSAQLEDFFQSLVKDSSEVLKWNEILQEVQAQSEGLAVSHEKRAEKVPPEAFQDAMALIRALGIPCLQPPHDEPREAEGICSTLFKLGLADLVVSEDSDVLVYGAPLLRRVSISQKRTPKRDPTKVTEDVKPTVDPAKVMAKMHIVDPEKLREELGVSLETFVDFALLSGTDFTDRIPGVGPSRALVLLKSHGSIESILSSQDKYTPRNQDVFLSKVQKARKIFLETPHLPEVLRDQLQEARFDEDKLKDLMLAWGFSNKVIKRWKHKVRRDSTSDRKRPGGMKGDKGNISLSKEVPNALDGML
ncbi:PIN domain-like protein [Meredithblackwellia eburnea MCA 4105]